MDRRQSRKLLIATLAAVLLFVGLPLALTCIQISREKREGFLGVELAHSDRHSLQPLLSVTPVKGMALGNNPGSSNCALITSSETLQVAGLSPYDNHDTAWANGEPYFAVVGFTGQLVLARTSNPSKALFRTWSKATARKLRNSTICDMAWQGDTLLLATGDGRIEKWRREGDQLRSIGTDDIVPGADVLAASINSKGGFAFCIRSKSHIPEMVSSPKVGAKAERTKIGSIFMPTSVGVTDSGRVIWTDGNEVVAWDKTLVTLPSSFPKDHPLTYSIPVSGEKALVWVGDVVEVYDLASKQRIARVKTTSPIVSGAFWPDGKGFNIGTRSQVNSYRFAAQPE